MLHSFATLQTASQIGKIFECRMPYWLISPIGEGNRSMARYRYDELTPSAFEDLIVDVCNELLGNGTTGFASGPDGGRDAKFEGTANGFPSQYAPWSGITIVQAKHTDKVEASYSDGDFLSNKNSTLNNELPRIKNLHDKGELDHYIIFSNRKMTGGAEQKIKNEISEYCQLSTADIAIYGTEKLDSSLRKHKDIAERHGLDLLASPLRVTRDSLANVIGAMHDALNTTGNNSYNAPTKRTTLRDKNEVNGIPEEEIEPLRKKYLKDVREIDEFLANPINRDLLAEYNEAVDELNDRLPSLLSTYGSFMKAWHGIYDILTNHDEVLRKNSRLVRAVQFYMYWSCDFGEGIGDAQAE